MIEDEPVRSPWRRVEVACVAALAITLVSLFIGQAAVQYGAQNSSPAIETAQAQPRFNAIDYAATAAVKGGTVIIGPCDTRAH